MMKIFLSPSNQTANVGAYKGTNECEQCERVAKYASDYLSGYDCAVMIATRTDNMTTRCAKAKEWGADFHIAIHTNAFSDKTVHGTETYYHSSDAKGKAFAAALLKAVGALTGCARASKSYDKLIELNTPTCARAYIEVDFHSNPERAEWIVSNAKAIGEAIAKTIIDFFGINKKQDTNRYTVTITDVSAADVEKLKVQYKNLEVKVYTKPVDSTEKNPPASVTETPLSVGDKVKLAQNATVYGQTYKFSSWVYSTTLYVRQINGNRIVISTKQTGAVTGAVDKKYLTKVEG